MDCSSSYLRMIAKYYGRIYALVDLREHAHLTKKGVSSQKKDKTYTNYKLSLLQFD